MGLGAKGTGGMGTKENDGNATEIGSDGTLNALHSNLAKLDAEIAVLQSGILDATRRQQPSPAPAQ